MSNTQQLHNSTSARIEVLTNMGLTSGSEDRTQETRFSRLCTTLRSS